jgi:hypothetical protein
VLSIPFPGYHDLIVETSRGLQGDLISGGFGLYVIPEKRAAHDRNPDNHDKDQLFSCGIQAHLVHFGTTEKENAEVRIRNPE